MDVPKDYCVTENNYNLGSLLITLSSLTWFIGAENLDTKLSQLSE